MSDLAKSGQTVTFVVPAYNEERMVADTVRLLVSLSEENGIRYEIILVNDGSSDSTPAIIDQLALASPHIKAIHSAVNKGLGSAYKLGVKAATGNFVMMIPGDNAHPKEGILEILNALGDADILIPYPINPEARTRFRQALSSAYTGLVNFLFSNDIPYYNGLVVHRRENIQRLEIRTDSFAYQTEALLNLLNDGVRYQTVSTKISERNEGRSKALRLTNIAKVFLTIASLFVRLRIRPMFSGFFYSRRRC